MPWFEALPATEIRRLVDRALGWPQLAWHDLSRDHADSRVACLRLADRIAAAPRLLGSDDASTTLLFEALPGVPDLADDDPAAPGVHRAAGRWLARFHRARPLQGDPLPLDRAYRLRSQRWTERARGLLDDGDLARIRERIEAASPDLARRDRTPCHRDDSPRNWLVSEGALAAVIDFEHARDDVPESDLVRLASDVWPHRPELRRSFLHGYLGEGGPADPHAPWMDALVALWALGTVAWARRHGDAAFERRGRDALARVLASG